MIKLFKNLRKQEWGLIVLALVFVVAQVWLDLTIPDYMADITRISSADSDMRCQDRDIICGNDTRKTVFKGAVIFDGRDWTFLYG